MIFVNTNPKNERIAVLKSSDDLNQLDDDDTNVFQKSLVDRYQHRPHTLRLMCLAKFAATYVVKYTNDDAESDVLPVDDTGTASSQIVLTDGFGKMNKRSHHAVIRFRRYNKDAEPSHWYRAKLMLYYPWYNEDADLLGGYLTHEEHYVNVRSIVVEHKSMFSLSDVEDMDFDIDGRPQHLWDQVAPSTENNRLRSNEEGSESLTNVSYLIKI